MKKKKKCVVRPIWLNLFSCLWFPLCSLSLPVQGPVCQPDGDDPAVPHHFPHRNKRGEWWRPHLCVSTASSPPPPPPGVLYLTFMYAQRSKHATRSWAFNSVKKMKRVKGSSWCTWERSGAAAWKRTINGEDGINNLLKAPFFPDNCVVLHVLCIKET